MALDYLAYQSGPSILEKAMSGYQFGAAQRQERELAAAKAEEVANQKAQFAQMQADLAALSGNPAAGASDYSKVMLKYPTMAEHIKKSFDLLTADQQQVKQKQAIQFYSALQGGQVDVARKLLETNIEASENAGLQQDAQASRAMLSLLETSPETAKTSAGLLLAQTMGEKQFGSVIGKLEEVRAAPEKRGLERERVDIEKEKVGIRKLEQQVSAMNVALGRETNDLKRQELLEKIEERRLNIKEKKRGIKDEVNQGVATTKNALSVLNDVLETVDFGAITGISSLTPTILPTTQDSLNKITQLKDLLTLENLELMTGVLTDRDIQVLSSAASGLVIDERGVKGSEKGVRKQLEMIQRKLTTELKKAEATRAEVLGEPVEEQETQQQTEYAEGTVIRNPATGETMILRNGKWEAQ